MAIIKQDDLIQSIADALQYISYYHPVDYITNLARAYELEAVPRRQRRHGPDPHQLAHVRRGPPPHLPGHRHRHHLRQGRHGRPAGTAQRQPRHPDLQQHVRRRASAAPTSTPTTSSAAQHPRRPRLLPQEHLRQHPLRRRRLPRPGRRRRRHRRSQRRRLRSQIQVRHAQPLRLHRRLGPQDRPHHGRRLVPPRHARHRHRRHRRKGHAPRQAVPHGPHRHAGTQSPRPQNQHRKDSASSSTTRSTTSASEPRASAASPPSSTSRSSTTPPTPPTSPSP